MMGSVDKSRNRRRETHAIGGGRGDLCLLIAYILTAFLLASCTSPPVTEEKSNTESVRTKRVREIRSVAYLIDLRFNDNGKKYSTITELYFQGDSVGFYGRGYFGKGSFKGKIINDTVTVYFPSQKQYFIDAMAYPDSSEDCFSPRRIIPYVLSLLSDWHETIPNYNRFEHNIRWSFEKIIYPKREELTDPHCGDTIIIYYSSCGNHFPYFKPQNISYRNGSYNFEAKGFIRQQVYNQLIDSGKFTVIIPSSAVRIDSL